MEVTVTVELAELAPASLPWLVLVVMVVLATTDVSAAGTAAMLTVTFRLAPLAKVAGFILKTTGLLVLSYVPVRPPAPVIVTLLAPRPAVKVRVREKPSAVLGPLLAKVTAKLKAPPAFTEPLGVGVMLVATSATGLTGMV